MEKGDHMNPLAPNRDWFLPAIEHSGGVRDSLGAVTVVLHEKADFIKALQTSLCSYQGKSSDSITELARRVHEFDTTLNFRLGMLVPSRPGAWFRENMNQGAGPFGTSVLSEPVFAHYKPEKVQDLKAKIQRSFLEKKVLTLPFDQVEPCLWLTLLSLNACWAEIDGLGGGFEAMSLSKMPESLPERLKSPALLAFLDKVRESLLDVGKDLDDCYSKLWGASCDFWDFQRSSLKQNRHTRGQRKSHSTRQTREPPNQTGRLDGARSVHDLRALQFMDFVDFPDRKDLRQRYLSLAQKFHPDRGGSEKQFQKLTQSYAHLMNRIEA